MNLIEKTNERVSISLSQQEFGLLYALISEVTLQWGKLDEAAILVSKEEADAVERELRQIAKEKLPSATKEARAVAS